jgi:WD40 repeat protein
VTAKNARIYDVDLGMELQRWGGENGVSSIVFSPDGKKIMTKDRASVIRIWDVEALLRPNRVPPAIMDF